MGPAFASELAETISVKNQCPPLLESYSQDGSPPLLHARLVSPMMVSSGIAPDWRWERCVEHHDLADVVGLDDEPVARAQPLIGRLDVADGDVGE
jgi:hypothetical protein